MLPVAVTEPPPPPQRRHTRASLRQQSLLGASSLQGAASAASPGACFTAPLLSVRSVVRVRVRVARLR